MAIDFSKLRVGMKLELDGGAIAQVLAPTEDGNWIRVLYISVPEDPGLAGTEDLCSDDEVIRIAAV